MLQCKKSRFAVGKQFRYECREAGHTRLHTMEATLTKTTIARSVLFAQVPYVYLRYPGFAVALDA